MTSRLSPPEHGTSIQDLVLQIQSAGTPERVIEAGLNVPMALAGLIHQGEPPLAVIQGTSRISDSIILRFIDLAVLELGPPPLPFSFMVFGSAGREEQTLKTDQDNAIVYDDPAEKDAVSTRNYFLGFGKKVCTWLNSSGYTFCKGENMAMNPRYCQPLSVWKTYFSQWVSGGDMVDLLKFRIFFDFRKVYGENHHEEDLRNHLEASVSENHRFFQILARNLLEYSPPLNFFGKFIVETEGPKRGGLNIKNATIPIVDFARIYAMRHRLRSVSTVERLDALVGLNILDAQSQGLVIETFSDLIGLRLKSQARAVGSAWASPSNHIYPGSLDRGERKHLKELLSRIRIFQSRLSYDFTGQASF